MIDNKTTEKQRVEALVNVSLTVAGMADFVAGAAAKRFLPNEKSFTELQKIAKSNHVEMNAFFNSGIQVVRKFLMNKFF